MYLILKTTESELVKDIINFRLPRYDELPVMGLYLEQVANYLNEYLHAISETPITSSMISNYVKHKIISKPIKKLYDRDQIASLIFIALAKNILQLNDLKKGLVIQQGSYSTKVAYDYFCVELENNLQYVFGLKDENKMEDNAPSPEKIMLHNMILTISYKIYLTKYFELYDITQNKG